MIHLDGLSLSILVHDTFGPWEQIIKIDCLDNIVDVFVYSEVKYGWLP